MRLRWSGQRPKGCKTRTDPDPAPHVLTQLLHSYAREDCTHTPEPDRLFLQMNHPHGWAARTLGLFLVGGHLKSWAGLAQGTSPLGMCAHLQFKKSGRGVAQAASQSHAGPGASAAFAKP